MEYLSVFITIGLFLKVFGSCPQNSSNTLVTSCDGTTKFGTPVFINFKQINQPCNCIVIPAFDGDLLVKADVTVVPCDAFVRVDSTFLFSCQQKTESAIVKVMNTHPVAVEADYKSESSRKNFYHCLQFTENMGGNGQVSVTCGEMTPSTYKTTAKSITTGGSSPVMLPITTETKDDTSTTENNSVNSTGNASNNFPDPSNALTEDELKYTILGVAAGGGLIIVVVIIIIVVIFLSRHKRRNKHKNKIPKETLTTFTEHTNNGYEYEHNLPDNPLYHSSQPANEVGYSTVEEQKPDPPMNESDQTPNIYDTPVKREMINDRDTKQEQPVYATPKKNQSIPVNYNSGDMYAQVNKPNKNRENSPVRAQNQDGLVYMEVDQSRDSNNENSPYTNDYSSETVAYAEVKTK